MTPILASEKIAERLQDGRIRISGRYWSDTFNEADLDRWAAFYARMAKDFGHRNPRYRETADALRSLAGGRRQ